MVVNGVELTFDQIRKLLQKLSDDNEYDRAIELIDLVRDRFPEQRLYFSYWQICMAAGAIKPQLVYHFMDELIADSLWISEKLLREPSFLFDLSGFGDYEARLAKFHELEMAEKAQRLPLLTIHKDNACFSEGNRCPLLLGLHADYENALSSIKLWQPAAENGWLVGIPQSKQALWSGAFVWEDTVLGQRQIETHVEVLREKYRVDEHRIVVAGYGMGGELAIRIAVSSKLPFCGFIAVFPEGSMTANPDAWMEWLQANSRELLNIKGIILATSNENGSPAPEISRIVSILQAFNVDCRLTTFPELEKMYPTDYKTAFLEALEIVSN